MSPSKKTISYSYIEPLISIVEKQQISLNHQIDYLLDPHFKKPISLLDYQILLTCILESENTFHLAHSIISDTEMTRHDILGLLVMCGLTLKQALKAMLKFYRLQVKFIRLNYEEQADHGLIKIETEGLEGSAAEFTLFMSILAMLKAKNDLIGPTEIEQVYLPFAESENITQLDILKPCQLYFNQPFYGLAFHFKTLNTKLKTANQITFEMLQKQCEQTLAQQSTSMPIDLRVSALLHDIQDLFPDLSQMASLLHISSRTLSRQLKQCDTSYQTLLDKEKIRRSKELLKLTDLSITDIASKLYFSDSSYFTKVFKKMVGQSPSDYRK